MKVDLTNIASCCGGSNTILSLEKPISRSDISHFRSIYTIPPSFTQAGIFYASKNGFIVSGSFGATKLSVKCSSPNCQQLINEFITILQSI